MQDEINKEEISSALFEYHRIGRYFDEMIVAKDKVDVFSKKLEREVENK
jgi:hypothetical protein